MNTRMQARMGTVTEHGNRNGLTLHDRRCWMTLAGLTIYRQPM